MKKAIIGKKLGMTQLFDEAGKIVPVTVVEAGPCVVVQKKTVENDGYEAVQVGFADIKEKNVNKPMKGHFEKAGVSAKRFLKEFKLNGATPLTLFFENGKEKSILNRIEGDLSSKIVIEKMKKMGFIE